MMGSIEALRACVRPFYLAARRLAFALCFASRNPHSRRTIMGVYVDGFVIPVPKKNLAAYKRMAKLGAKVWREYGALQYRECIADDVKPGKLTSFPQSVKLKKNEVVWFSYIVYKSRKDRNRIMGKVMSDPRLAEMMNGKDMPFDGKRMFWGGFKAVVDL
jgi:uncharacterized protein YbaA (DUF1428 family)